jgi:hypothetical protein
VDENGKAVDDETEHGTKEELSFYDEPENTTQKWNGQMDESHDTHRRQPSLDVQGAAHENSHPNKTPCYQPIPVIEMDKVEKAGRQEAEEDVE